MAAPSFDAIVVGSGITGGWAAKELCERGLKTLVLEAGRPIDPARDYVEHVPPWEMKFRGFGDRMALNCAEQVVRDGVAKRFAPERVVTIGRVAILTAPHRGRAACHYCGPCERGCITHSYFNSIGVTLPVARATGRLTLRPYSVVHSVIYDEQRDRAAGVRVIDGQTREPLEFRARIVFLCASTLESTRILLNSKGPRFPTGLANSSGELGRNLMDHALGGGANGAIPGMEYRTVHGNRPNGIYVPRFRNVKTPSPDFLRGYGFQGGGGRGRHPTVRGRHPAGPDHPRNGDRPHGPRPEDVGLERP